MTNNKAREVNNPIIKELLDETSPEELAKIDAEMTNNKQQTAVDWLIEKCACADLRLELWEIVKQQAKEMEIEQHANTWNNAINAVEKDKWQSFEQYYKQTYGGGEQ
jgi:hypothetical protein